MSELQYIDSKGAVHCVVIFSTNHDVLAPPTHTHTDFFFYIDSTKEIGQIMSFVTGSL